jgi:hypothetical protein
LHGIVDYMKNQKVVYKSGRKKISYSLSDAFDCLSGAPKMSKFEFQIAKEKRFNLG